MNKPLSMVDVSRKKASSRRAVAVAEVRMQKKTAALIRQGRIEKGDVFSSATLVGILAAKKTPQLIPLCHPIAFSHINISLRQDKDVLRIEAEVRGRERTGYEMEALTAVSLAALNVYDMCKSIDKDMRIAVRLLEKEGGRSGRVLHR